MSFCGDSATLVEEHWCFLLQIFGCSVPVASKDSITGSSGSHIVVSERDFSVGHAFIEKKTCVTEIAEFSDYL